MYTETIIVRHRKERKQKCSVQPLTKKDGFQFVSFPNETAENISSYMRLSTEGPLLSKSDSNKGLLILDCNWRYIPDMEEIYGDVTARSLPYFKTAYPRCSKDNTDPDEGLATIEAIYIAYCILGYGTKGLLDDYYFGNEFLKINRERFMDLKE
ncbi:MAG: DUF367 domain-containing protein [Desulfobacterales bacterium]|nr:DUF367 domain-containing protein [Desulfobacterales bacterium]MCP4162925.1 DUF367 domain-containing protein [Deltaproteobacteria bacterium]